MEWQNGAYVRVIAGIYRGRKLYSPAGDAIRPTADKVKGAVFSMLGEAVVGAEIIDLFAGTGALGIEALSRGASRCLFCDVSPQSLALVKRNLDAIGVGNAEIVRGDFKRALMRIGCAGSTRRILFADPPYSAGYYDEIMQIVIGCDIINEGGFVVFERSADNPSADYESFEKLRARKYGKTGIDLYERV